MEKKYIKNIDEIFSETLQKKILTKNITVIGCGGQGGYILEYLARLGVKSINFWDGDVYDETNINRQIGCLETTIGLNKALVLKERLQQINSTIQLNCFNWYFGDKSSDIIQAKQSDIIFLAADCYYNVKKLRLLLRSLLLEGIPLIDCPANLLGGYVSIQTKDSIYYFDQQTQKLINQSNLKDSLPDSGQPAYKCALVAAEAVNQMVQYFNNCRYANINSVLNIDIYHHKYQQEDQYGII